MTSTSNTISPVVSPITGGTIANEDLNKVNAWREFSIRAKDEHSVQSDQTVRQNFHKIIRGDTGIGAIVLNLTPDSRAFSADANGVVTAFDNTNFKLDVKEGKKVFKHRFDQSTLANGQYRVSKVEITETPISGSATVYSSTLPASGAAAFILPHEKQNYCKWWWWK